MSAYQSSKQENHGWDGQALDDSLEATKTYIEEIEEDIRVTESYLKRLRERLAWLQGIHSVVTRAKTHGQRTDQASV